MKLTNNQLRKIIEEEVSKSFGDEKDVEKAASETEEVEADEFADSLEKKIDYVKALKVEEARTLRAIKKGQARLKKIRESKARALKTL